jgi:hypothetical protein
MPIIEAQGFVFTRNGNVLSKAARSLQEFLLLLDQVPAEVMEAHIVRHDFSRWIAAVFRDEYLASQIRALEEQAQLVGSREFRTEVAAAIHQRYELRPATPDAASAG